MVDKKIVKAWRVKKIVKAWRVLLLRLRVFRSRGVQLAAASNEGCLASLGG